MVELNQQITNLFPLLIDALNSQGKHILSFSSQVLLPAKTTIFYQGKSCSNYLLVVSGSVKVFTRSINGKELNLYHVKSGNSCVLTTSCLFSNNNYTAEGVTETDVVAIVIPVKVFHQFLDESKTFRQLIFQSYSQNISTLIELINKISFFRLDYRVALFLTDHSSESSIINITHQSIATELGSAREVVSRQLKDFELKGWIKVSRGKIEIVDSLSLKNFKLDINF